MLVNKNNKQQLIIAMARKYNKPISEIEMQIEQRPEILEGFAEYLANDLETTSKHFKSYKGNYYE